MSTIPPLNNMYYITGLFELPFTIQRKIEITRDARNSKIYFCWLIIRSTKPQSDWTYNVDNIRIFGTESKSGILSQTKCCKRRVLTNWRRLSLIEQKEFVIWKYPRFSLLLLLDQLPDFSDLLLIYLLCWLWPFSL